MDTAVGIVGMVTFPVVMSFGLQEVISGSTLGPPSPFHGVLPRAGAVVAVVFSLAYAASLAVPLWRSVASDGAASWRGSGGRGFPPDFLAGFPPHSGPCWAGWTPFWGCC
ncbi:MAG: hypothetical protein CM15mP77_4360 [Synechococcus sp.]|nr:MAG: hypothetical protein CM15mP77_4360 [Synechococcus sp.]